jgi:hypothetical protein
MRARQQRQRAAPVDVRPADQQANAQTNAAQ